MAKVTFLTKEHRGEAFLVPGTRKLKQIRVHEEGVPVYETIDPGIVVDFTTGLCSVEDERAIKFLDAMPGVWRDSDPLADIKFNLDIPSDQMNVLEAAITAKLEATKKE